MTYDEFKRTFPIGTSIGKPFPPYDYIGECVSYWLQKAVKVDAAPFNAPLGHAAQIPSNPTFLQYYEKIPDSERKVGDAMFWGDGSMTGPEGHVAIYDGGEYMMNQNYNGSRVISRNNIFTSAFMGYYRIKGEDMTAIADKTILTKLWVGYANQYPAPDSYLDYWNGTQMGVPNDVLDWLEKQPIHTELIRKASEYDGLVDENVKLKEELAMQDGDFEEATVYVKKKK